jgi:hypothetical protein
VYIGGDTVEGGSRETLCQLLDNGFRRVLSIAVEPDLVGYPVEDMQLVGIKTGEHFVAPQILYKDVWMATWVVGLHGATSSGAGVLTTAW